LARETSVGEGRGICGGKVVTSSSSVANSCKMDSYKGGVGYSK